MNDVNCPYCDTAQDIDHDDGHGYSEGVKHEQQCVRCDKNFIFHTSIIYHYEVEKADCLNGAEHDFQPTKTYPRQYAKMECSVCDKSREPTDEEMHKILTENT